MGTTTKKDLIDRIAQETNQKRTVVKATVQAFLDNVIRELGDGNRLEFRDFGVFEIRDRAPRVAQNPRTLEQIPVPASKTVKFKVGRLMKSVLDGEEVEQAAAADQDEAASDGSEHTPRPRRDADGDSPEIRVRTRPVVAHRSARR